jgi:hypothetical protein
MGNLEIDPDALERAGSDLGRPGATFGDALTAFQSTMAGFGQPWGGDDIGQLIGAAYEEVSSWAFECYQSAAQEIVEAGVDVAAMGAAHRGNEAATGERFSAIDRQW